MIRYRIVVMPVFFIVAAIGLAEAFLWRGSACTAHAPERSPA